VPSVPYDANMYLEEIEELEIHEKGVAISRFREYTADILYTTFLFLQQSFGEEGEQVIYNIITSGLQA